jgi:hypothetical protein
MGSSLYGLLSCLSFFSALLNPRYPSPSNWSHNLLCTTRMTYFLIFVWLGDQITGMVCCISYKVLVHHSHFNPPCVPHLCSHRFYA